jgi:hypothetical protein
MTTAVNASHPVAVAAAKASAAIKADPTQTSFHLSTFLDSLFSWFKTNAEPAIAAVEPIANIAATVDPAIAPEVAAGEGIVGAAEGLINGANTSTTASTVATVVQPAVAVAESVDPKITPAVTAAEQIAAEAENIENLIKSL